MRLLRVQAALAALLAFVAGPALAQAPAYAVTPRTVLASEGAPAVVRLYETTFRVESPGRATTTVTLVTTALTPAGREAAGALRVVHGGFRRLARLDGVLRDARGAVVRRVGRRDVDEVALGSIYEDLRLSSAELYGARTPFTVEWSYEIEHDGVLGWPTWRPQPAGAAVEAASFRLDVPAGTAVRTRPRDVGSGVSRPGAERDVYAWAVADLAARAPEPFGPPAWAQGPELRLGTDHFEIGGAPGRLDSWQAFGAWYGGLADGRQTLPTEARHEVRRIVADAPTPREAARRLYRHLQETTRYVSIQLGLGGWQPFDAAYVFERRLGDCKALTNYLQAMLAVAGIDADPVLIQAGEHAALDPDFPENAFNHVVLRLPMRTETLDGGEAVWLECTSPYASFGHLGAFTEGRLGLRIAADGGALVRTPTSAPETNRTARTARLRLDDRGRAEAWAHWTLAGESRADALAALDGADDLARAALVRALTASSVDVVAFASAESAPDVLALDAELRLPAAARRAGTRLLLDLTPLVPPPPALPEARDRRHPLRLGAASVTHDSVRVELPPGATVVRLPEPVELESVVGRYTLGARAEGGTLVIVRELTVSAPDQPAEAYADARAFFQAVADADAGLAVLRLGNG